MEQEMILSQLQQAERQVVAAKEHIAKQRETIERLRRSGRNTKDAERLLTLLNGALRAQTENRSCWQGLLRRTSAERITRGADHRASREAGQT